MVLLNYIIYNYIKNLKVPFLKFHNRRYLIINIDHKRFLTLSKNQVFPSFSSLYLYVTDEKLPCGGRNKSYIEAEFKRHIHYCKHCELDSKVESKREICILEIYDSPLEQKENRGNRGKYIDLLKPLFIQKGHFHGTLLALSAEWGIFTTKTTLTEEEKISSLLQPNSSTFQGASFYIYSLSHTVKTALIRALKSLKKDDIINWEYRYQILPNVLQHHLIYYQKRKDLLSLIESDSNAAITADDLNLFLYFLHRECPVHSISYDNSHNKPRPVSIREADDEAIILNNLNIFVMQYVYKNAFRMLHLPAKDDLPNPYEFLLQPKLKTLYESQKKEIYLSLIGCSVWKEIRYHVIGIPEQLSLYFPSGLDTEKSAQTLCRLFWNHMNKNMSKLKFPYPTTSKDLQDIKDKFKRKGFRGRAAKANFLEKELLPLEAWNSACKLHEMLKSKYDI